MDNFRKRSRPNLAQFEAVHEMCTTKLADRHEVMLYLRNDPSINPDTWDKKKKKLPAAALHMVVICTPRMLDLLITCDVRTAQPPHAPAAARTAGPRAQRITQRACLCALSSSPQAIGIDMKHKTRECGGNVMAILAFTQRTRPRMRDRGCRLEFEAGHIAHDSNVAAICLANLVSRAQACQWPWGKGARRARGGGT